MVCIRCQDDRRPYKITFILLVFSNMVIDAECQFLPMKFNDFGIAIGVLCSGAVSDVIVKCMLLVWTNVASCWQSR